MKKHSTTQKIIMGIGIVGALIGFYGKWTGWAYDDYFAFFYTGMTMVWITFLPSSRSCCIPFWKKSIKKQQ
ncbi:hypothetical protein J0X14_05265 [Muricauda sp. CAU 1633]|uniref:hypothetical protein n=1 Tax=Allomuricauda sp. CAU 1633 TaxID=2816036 RepID=UPI001A8E6B2E|nr:hypothetical protein [Muricauda sp. CAU 1633]MBO0321695.1 hypothetical protein [Muricauda sp. CAU 1633]